MSLRELKLFPYTHSEGLWPAWPGGRDVGIEKKVQKERGQLLNFGWSSREPGGELELRML